MGKNRTLPYIERAAAAIANPANAVGRIKKTYGTNRGGKRGGALLISLYDTFPEIGIGTENDDAEPLWVEIDSRAVPLFIASFERRGGGAAVVQFDDFERAEEAELLVGKVLYCAGREEAANDDTDFGALIGCELTDRTTGRRGTVTAFYDYPGNPLLGVEFDGRETLVPAADDLIETVDMRKRTLVAELPEGLFDL